MWVKICGTTNEADAALAVRLGADALGFLFAPSKRRVSVEQAAAITRTLPATVEKVGVFTEPNGAEIARTVVEARLTAVQVHSAHETVITSAIKGLLPAEVKVIQVVPFDVGLREPEEIRARFEAPLREALSDPAVWAVLLDASKGGASGGLGTAFGWELARPAVERATGAARALGGEARELPRLLLAGGLGPGNVQAAIAALEPWGVDVVSGVEANPGHKDPDLLAAFLASARRKREGYAAGGSEPGA